MIQAKSKRVAIYLRVSTDDQSVAMQERELKAWAERAGHSVAKVYQDRGLSGAKGRDKRPAFNALLDAAVRRECNMIAVWASDRLGRSLSHLVEVLEIIKSTGVGLYIHTQALDTTTPGGRAMFGMLGVFAEFEREMIAARVRAGLKAAKARGVKLGRQVGDRPTDKLAPQVLAMHREGHSYRKIRDKLGLSTTTIMGIVRRAA